MYSSTLVGRVFTFLMSLFTYFVFISQLAGCIMSVRGSKLAGAAEANSFSGWRECERFLVHSGQSNRGWFPFLRSHIQAKDLPD